MSRELLIIRHAKSSRSDPTLADHERPLAPRGERAAPLMGQRIAERGPRPERIVSSDALRARRTAELLADAMGLDQAAIALDARLYEAGPAAWLEIIREQPDACRRIALVGHNPAIADTARELLGRDVGKVRTAAVIHIRLAAASWAEASPACAEWIGIDDPRQPG